MNLFSKLKKMKILLIDDDEWIRDSLSLFFESKGCHLRALMTAEEGMGALKREDYDIIISDYRLPGMDGLKFFTRISGSHHDTIKILITAFGNEEVISEAKRIGIEDIIEKPFTTTNIEESLSQLIEKHDKENQQPNLEH